MILSEKWVRHFFEEAKLIAKMSKDPSAQVGAVIVRPDKTIASKGFNGFPRGMNDSKYLYAERETKYDRIIHAEMNAILNSREPLHGYSLFTWPLAPCTRCAVHIIQAGIIAVYAPEMPEYMKVRWSDSIAKTISYFEEARVEYYEIKARKEIEIG